LKILPQNTLLKVLSLNSISVAISFILGLFSTKIVSYFLGTPGMALLGSFRNLSTLLKSMATLGISNSIIKLFVENKNNKQELAIIYSTFFWLFLIISSIFGCLTLIFSTTLSSYLFFTPSYAFPIQLFGISLPLMVINTFWLAIFNGLEKFKSLVIIQIVSTVLVFGASALLIWRNSIIGGLVSIAIGELIMVVVTYFFIRRETDYFRFDLQRILSKKYLKIIKNFSIMALVSGLISPLALVIIRNTIVSNYSINDAGIWDAINRVSNFYMVFFSSGLSMYYLPKLASLQTDSQFKRELKSYFKILVPLFSVVLVLLFVFKSLLIKIAFTEEFSSINELLIWQLLGDFFRIMTLAFGYQIVIKTMMKRYFIGELVFNLSYVLLSYYLMKSFAVEGVLQAYLIANIICFILVVGMFRKLFIKSNS
jgi:O-antigen/teichoic acid export membrane protein